VTAPARAGRAWLWVTIALTAGAFAVAVTLAPPAAAAPAALLRPSVVTWLLLPFFGWQFLHFQKQNLGVVALAASSGGTAPLRRGERRALGASGGTGTCALLAHPALLQLSVDPRLELLFPLSGAAFGLAVCWDLRCSRDGPRRTGRRGSASPTWLRFSSPCRYSSSLRRMRPSAG